MMADDQPWYSPTYKPPAAATLQRGELLSGVITSAVRYKSTNCVALGRHSRKWTLGRGGYNRKPRQTI